MSTPVEEVQAVLAAEGVTSVYTPEERVGGGLAEDVGKSEKIPPMTDEEIEKYLLNGYEQARLFREAELEPNWIKAYQSYYTEVETNCDGWSMAKTTDVADTVEALLASIAPVFDVSQLCVFPPMDMQDVKQAERETKFLNWLFRDRNKGYMLIYSALKEAFLQKNAIGKVEVDFKQSIEVRTLVISEFELVQLYQQAEQGMFKIIEAAEEDNGVFSVKINETRYTPIITVNCIAPENFIVNQDHDSIYLKEALITGDEEIITTGELIEEGFDYDKVMALPPSTGPRSEISSVKRNDRYSETERNTTVNDPMTRQVRIARITARIDYNRDGEIEIIKGVLGENAMLDWEETSCVPYVSGSPFPVPHRYVGVSIYDKIYPIEDTKQTIVREGINNMLLANRPRPVTGGSGVDYDDLLNWKIGSPIQTNRPGDLSWSQIPYYADQTLGLISYFDGQRSERAGATLDMQTQPGVDGTAHGVERQTSNRELLAAQIARVFAETFIKEIFLLMHKLMRENINEVLSARIGGEWIQVNPADWRPREDIEVTLGMSPGERLRKIQALSGQMQLQTQLQREGSVLVNDMTVHRTAVAIGMAEELNFPDQYWVDPMSPEGQQALQNKQQAQKAAQQQQEEQAQALLDLQKYISDNTETSKRMQIHQKQMSDMRKEFNEMKRHNDDLMTKLTELELVHGKDVPGSTI